MQSSRKCPPRHVEFTRDGKEAWIAAEAGGTVQIADVVSRKITTTLHFAIPGIADYRILPCGIRFTPDGATAVVALGRADHVALVDVKTRKVKAYVPEGKRVWHVAISNDGRRAYSANGLSNNVSVIDLENSKLIDTIPAGESPWGLVAAP